jgi:hypothetical protein
MLEQRLRLYVTQAADRHYQQLCRKEKMEGME